MNAPPSEPPSEAEVEAAADSVQRLANVLHTVLFGQ